jgi:hypothetical protein
MIVQLRQTRMLDVKIKTQPDSESCGPTSLHAIYRYYDDPIELSQVMREVPSLHTGGTLAVLLGIHALNRNYSATLYSYDLNLLDPEWLNNMPKEELIRRLKMQNKYKRNKKLLFATRAYIDYLELGGKLTSHELSPNLLKSYFRKKIPILAGVSATYLYGTVREYTTKQNVIISDDIRGYPSGHFVVLCGYDDKNKKVVIADSYRENPVSNDNYYSVNISRLLNSILLGIITYDANILIIEPNHDLNPHGLIWKP